MSYSEWMRRYRRAIGIPFVIAALLLAHFDTRFLYADLALIVSGEAIRIWAAGHLRKEEILSTGGPYRLLRNPLYFGSLLIALGFSSLCASYWILLLVAVYFLISYVPVMRYEEGILKQRFGEAFEDYAKTVPAFYPRLKPWSQPNTKFSWHQVWKNKEYNAIAGIAVGILLLAVFRR